MRGKSQTWTKSGVMVNRDLDAYECFNCQQEKKKRMAAAVRQEVAMRIYAAVIAQKACESGHIDADMQNACDEAENVVRRWQECACKRYGDRIGDGLLGMGAA